MRAGGIYLFGEPAEKKEPIPNEYDKELDDFITKIKELENSIEITIENILNKQKIVDLYLNGSYKAKAVDRLEKEQQELIDILDDYTKSRMLYKQFISDNLGKFNSHSNEYEHLDVWPDATKIVEICYRRYKNKFIYL